MNRHGMQTPINVAFKFGQWNRLELLGVKCELSYQRREGRTRVNAFFFLTSCLFCFFLQSSAQISLELFFLTMTRWFIRLLLLFFFYGKWKVLFNYKLVHITISAAPGIQSLVSPRLVRSLIFATVTKLE